MAWLTEYFSPYVVVACGGAIGSMLRYAVGRGLSSWLPGSPSLWATGGVNMVGSFVLGCVVMAFGASHRGNPWVLFLGVGLCGGFTTFSTLSMELADLIHSKRLGLAAWYGFGSLLVGWIAFMAGAWIMQRMAKGQLG